MTKETLEKANELDANIRLCKAALDIDFDGVFESGEGRGAKRKVSLPECITKEFRNTLIKCLSSYERELSAL